MDKTKRKRKIWLTVIIVLSILFIWQRKLIYYGYVQAEGQIKVVKNAVPVSTLLADPKTPDSIKYKLRLINEIKQFAYEKIGISPSNNYTSMYDQQGKPILWVVTVCEPFQLQEKSWSFPVIGSFSYKGFFRYEMAEEEEKIWKDQGYDTGIRTAGGWSTLGWFNDPILSNMLKRQDGELAELIIHELTHGTLFVKDSVAFNENLATFIGIKGAEFFLENKFGEASDELISYQERNLDEKKWTNHILRGAVKLDSFYLHLDSALSLTEKQDAKNNFINNIIYQSDTLKLFNKDRYTEYAHSLSPNNTYFMSFLRYNEDQEQFEKIYLEEFDQNLKEYLLYLKTKFASL
jgi:predicted aminopeptidase